MVSVEAAGADPDMREAADAGARVTHQVHLALTQALHERGALRDDLDATTAADILYALVSEQEGPLNPMCDELHRHPAGA